MEKLQQIWLSFWDTLTAKLGGGRIMKGVLSLGLVYLLITGVLGIYWSWEPAPLDLQAANQQNPADQVVGVGTTSALIGITEMLLEKPGGYLTNDLTPPGVWLDNMPSWEFGVLVQTRDMARAMRKDFSRSQSQSTEDPDLAKAEPMLNFNNNSWLFPSTEGEYKKALKGLKSYYVRLQDTQRPDAQFFARADNLNNWLGNVSTRLGSLSQRLSASVGQKRLNTDLAGEISAEQSTTSQQDMEVKTSWFELDNVFYEARGTAWALIQLLKGVEQDFGPTLDKKNARVSLLQIIRELESTQGAIWSPMILNGNEFGLLANHSLVMASYISRANAAIIDLRDLLSQG
ncbi:DUF2333 family protein [Neptunomonas antarctica]|uniref:DUF2333 domain-containing protein n=1 Tax=Neptunomonas antarctica TaxID=619304 RepID=A0A1N7MZ15_9GAMM|nr:DUF2333 family protein [Neptunomonas antarctica]SIS91181.1 hypothetical protein SAMN05421760_107122 [Neptunomonas antarctica]